MKLSFIFVVALVPRATASLDSDSNLWSADNKILNPEHIYILENEYNGLALLQRPLQNEDNTVWMHKSHKPSKNGYDGKTGGYSLKQSGSSTSAFLSQEIAESNRNLIWKNKPTLTRQTPNILNSNKYKPLVSGRETTRIPSGLDAIKPVIINDGPPKYGSSVPTLRQLALSALSQSSNIQETNGIVVSDFVKGLIEVLLRSGGYDGTTGDTDSSLIQKVVYALTKFSTERKNMGAAEFVVTEIKTAMDLALSEIVLLVETDGSIAPELRDKLQTSIGEIKSNEAATSRFSSELQTMVSEILKRHETDETAKKFKKPGSFSARVKKIVKSALTTIGKTVISNRVLQDSVTNAVTNVIIFKVRDKIRKQLSKRNERSDEKEAVQNPDKDGDTKSIAGAFNDSNTQNGTENGIGESEGKNLELLEDETEDEIGESGNSDLSDTGNVEVGAERSELAENRIETSGSIDSDLKNTTVDSDTNQSAGLEWESTAENTHLETTENLDASNTSK